MMFCLTPSSKTLKFSFCQVLHEPVAVKHSGVEDDFFDVLAKNIASAFLADFVGGSGGGRRRRASARGRGPR